MKIAIAGGSGFIGKQLIEILVEKGHEIVILTRREGIPLEGVSYVNWLKEGATPEKELDKVDVIINLAGASINDGRWNAKHQQEIYFSRMAATEELLRIISVLAQKPSAFINASAVGIYPTSLDNVYTEDSLQIANDFLGNTVKDWENKAKRVEKYGVRTALMRFGVVLGNEKGALPLMALPYKFYLGGTVGSGEQWVSWVHVLDAIRAIEFVIEKDSLSGPVNVTSPSPLRMKDFGKTIGSVLKRPHWLPAPALLMKLVLGQKSKLVLEGQKVLPKALLEEGFEFLFPTLDLALEDLFIH